LIEKIHKNKQVFDEREISVVFCRIGLPKMVGE